MRQNSWKESFLQEQKEFVNDSLGCLFSPGCLLFTLGIIGLVLFMICMCVFDIRLPETDNKEQQKASSAKNIAWDYLKEQEPYAKIKRITATESSNGYIVEGQFKKKNAFGQYAVHQFRASIKDGEIVDFHTDFIGFE